MLFIKKDIQKKKKQGNKEWRSVFQMAGVVLLYQK